MQRIPSDRRAWRKLYENLCSEWRIRKRRERCHMKYAIRRVYKVELTGMFECPPGEKNLPGGAAGSIGTGPG